MCDLKSVRFLRVPGAQRKFAGQKPDFNMQFGRIVRKLTHYFGFDDGRNKVKKALALSFFIVSLLAGLAWAYQSNTGTNTGNTSTGDDALASDTTGSYNTADGFCALQLNTTGLNNTAVGNHALYSNTSGKNNTAVGAGALYYNTASENTAVGLASLESNTTGGFNTALGYAALIGNKSGGANTAVGSHALSSNTTGNANTAVGFEALFNNNRNANTALGHLALFSNTHGVGNTALGYLAGYYAPHGTATATTGSNNIYIGNDVSPQSADESYTIRIGKPGDVHQTFIAGIYGKSAGGSEVFITAEGQLSSRNSSRRYKEDIEDMGDASSGLMKLRPVTFYYKPEYANGPRRLQYGLVAEEVAEIYPDLVQYDPKTKQPQTVHYHLVNAMLLNEVQKQAKEIAALKEQNKEVSALNERVKELSALVEQNKELTSMREQVKEQGLDLSALKERDNELSALKEQIKELCALVEKRQDPTAKLSKLEDRLIK
ncbi:MAG TPA: tail fiber domain-containing protein [Syntrophobacteraceae bacterium]|nr:tail fiber domain-containing protein [Syntrophobacteraceae bacterium]